MEFFIIYYLAKGKDCMEAINGRGSPDIAKCRRGMTFPKGRLFSSLRPLSEFLVLFPNASAACVSLIGRSLLIDQSPRISYPYMLSGFLKRSATDIFIAEALGKWSLREWTCLKIENFGLMIEKDQRRHSGSLQGEGTPTELRCCFITQIGNTEHNIKKWAQFCCSSKPYFSNSLIIYTLLHFWVLIYFL